ncbi:hypothetical protein CWI36_1857p0010 [Hamiltosporidium magnivora]|uniref:Uncharacterized protein n=1 Tax=Hamiltosporidium magnivora TaxID=148818 RepID=A0A4Q9KYK4_9MICR|nr:hypothetical protein CWI36_1857p0010 [Hamiltosporidium magnivora]
MQTKGKVLLTGNISSDFRINLELRQGDTLSCVMFNLKLKGIIRKLVKKIDSIIFNETTQHIAYECDLPSYEKYKKILTQL